MPIHTKDIGKDIFQKYLTLLTGAFPFLPPTLPPFLSSPLPFPPLFLLPFCIPDILAFLPRMRWLDSVLCALPHQHISRDVFLWHQTSKSIINNLQACFTSPLASKLLKQVTWTNPWSRSGKRLGGVDGRSCKVTVTKGVGRRRMKNGDHECNQLPHGRRVPQVGRPGLEDFVQKLRLHSKHTVFS